MYHTGQKFPVCSPSLMSQGHWEISLPIQVLVAICQSMFYSNQEEAGLVESVDTSISCSAYAALGPGPGDL